MAQILITSITDVRKEINSQWKQEMRRAWYSNHIMCPIGPGDAHRWSEHFWEPDIKAFIWKPCDKCGMVRVVTSTLDALEINYRLEKKAYFVRAFIEHDGFIGTSEKGKKLQDAIAKLAKEALKLMRKHK